MERIAGLIAVIAISINATTVFADSTATYTGSVTNQTTVTNMTGYQTVIIAKVPDNADPSAPVAEDNVVYIDEDSSAFSGTVNFMIKDNPSYGKYKVQMGSDSGETALTYFYIGIDEPSGDSSAVTMKRVGEAPDPKGVGYWNVGYILEVPISAYNDFNSVKVSYDSVDNYIENSSSSDIKTGGYNKVAEMPAPYYKNWPDSISGEGDVKLAFQINHVPAAYKDSITVYMSNRNISDTYLNR